MHEARLTTARVDVDAVDEYKTEVLHLQRGAFDFATSLRIPAVAINDMSRFTGEGTYCSSSSLATSRQETAAAARMASFVLSSTAVMRVERGAAGASPPSRSMKSTTMESRKNSHFTVST
jgi:hypothetical protein